MKNICLILLLVSLHAIGQTIAVDEAPSKAPTDLKELIINSNHTIDIG